MPSLVSLLQQLRDLVKEPDSASLTAVISTLALDMSAATVNQMRNGDFTIVHAKRQVFPLAPTIVVGVSERRRMIFMLLDGPDRIVCTDDLMAGLSTKIEPSKHDGGFGITALISSVRVGCTVSTADHRVQSIFCEMRSPGER